MTGDGSGSNGIKAAQKMQIGLITLFPEMFAAVSDFGVSGRAVAAGLVDLHFWNPRDFTDDRHRTVDDRPFGGGPGMLMKTEPLLAAVKAAKAVLDTAGQPTPVPGTGAQPSPVPGAGTQRTPVLDTEGHRTSVLGTEARTTPVADTGGWRTPVLYLSPQGRPLDQPAVRELAARPSMILLCGRYQGIDARVIEAVVDEEWSLGDFVLSGGETAAMALIDAVIRLQPGALGDADSAQQDSFADGLLHWPEYTRPQVFNGQAVPPVLLSGDHEAIRRWRLRQSLAVTLHKRPDLLDGAELNEEQRRLLQQIKTDDESQE